MIKINAAVIKELNETALSCERKRINFNLHKVADDTMHRLINAIEPYSYIQPHKHENPDKREIFVIIKGRFVVVEFDDTGNITDHFILDAALGNCVAEIPARKFHSIFSLESGSVIIEFKDGPYNVADDKLFASWAPKEGDADSKIYIDNLLQNLNLKISAF
jgi:cupin fold WbuC family metalloprotein